MCKYLDNYPGLDKCTARNFKRSGRGVLNFKTLAPTMEINYVTVSIVIVNSQSPCVGRVKKDFNID